jgi:uncharacterized protein YndB with AHSA1/START domain
MKKIEFNIDINADVQKVWDTLLNPETYKEVAGSAFPGSYYIGNWKKGENIRFLSPQGGGTLANIVDLKPNESITAKHVAVINSDGTEDRTSDLAKGWVGSTETYTFSKRKDGSNFKAEMEVNPEWEKMFVDSWPRILGKLKELSEN